MSSEEIKKEKSSPSKSKSDEKKKHKKSSLTSSKSKSKSKHKELTSKGIKKKKKSRKKKSGTESKRISKTIRAGLTFPPARFMRNLKKGNFAPRIGMGAGLYMAAVVEYLCAEVLELSGNAAQDNKKVRISPRHVMLAVRNDEELNKLLRDVYISEAGVVPSVHRILMHTIEQRRKLQKIGELPNDTVLATQVTDPGDAVQLSQQQGRSSMSPTRSESPKKKHKKSKKHKSKSSSDSSRSRKTSRSRSRSRSEEEQSETLKEKKKKKKRKHDKEEKEKGEKSDEEQDLKKKTDDSEEPKKKKLSNV